MSDDRGARAEKRGGALTLTVDRPRALNALNSGVIEFFHDALDSGERDDSVAVYVIRGAGRAFCAGGDVRAVREMLLRGDSSRAIAFFAREFALNGRLARLRKPSCAVWNGVVMGGGAGLSCYADVRVATERTVFAMPECAIGLYPDVGAGWFFKRAVRARDGDVSQSHGGARAGRGLQGDRTGDALRAVGEVGA